MKDLTGLISPHVPHMHPSQAKPYLDNLQRAEEHDIEVAYALQGAAFSGSDEPEKARGFLAPMYLQQAMYLRDNADARFALAKLLTK